MGRSITFNLLEGTGTVQAPAHGWLSIRPTKEHITGSMVVLATEDERRINSQGVVTFPDVQPTPDEDPNTGKYPWAYIVKYRNITGYETSWTVLVPVGTTPLQGSQLIQVVPDDVHYTIMQGPAGEKGDGIHVYGAYPTVSAMEAANPLPKRGDSYLIGSKLYVWDGATWGNSSDLQGAKGDKGDKGIQGQQGTTGLKGDTGLTGATPAITTVANTGEPGSATAVVKSGTNVAPVLTFTIPRGDKGETGAQGLKGDKGDTGDQGTPGQGVPTADGSNGAVITYSDGQTLWVDPNTLIPAATEQQAGLMTAADKVKLGVAATVQQVAVARDHARAKASCVFGEYLGSIYSLVKAGNGGPTPGMVEKRFGGTALPGTGTSCTPVMDTLDTYAARHIRPIAFNASGWKVSGNIGEVRGAQILGGQVFHDFENFDTSPAGIEALGVRADGTVGLYSKLNGDSAASMVADGVESSFSYGPILVRDGVKRVLSDARWLYFADTTLSARQIFGTDAAGNFMVCTVEGVSPVSGLTGPQAADLAVILGFRQAVLMDGGGSAQAYANGVQAMPSADAGGRRAVPDALLINAELLDPAVDTGWWDVQYKAGYQQNSRKLQVRQRAGVTYLQGDVKPTSGNFGVAADAVVANIRSRFRHSGAAKPFLVLGNGENTRKVVANSAGDISVVAMAQSSTPPYLNLGNVSWL